MENAEKNCWSEHHHTKKLGVRSLALALEPGSLRQLVPVPDFCFERI